jgi:tetratricopeptide (TPR) repeat protein
MDLQVNRKVQMKQTTCVCVAIVAFGVGTGCIATKQTYLSRGNKFYDQGKYADASLNYLKAIQKDPKFGEAHFRLGLSAMKQEQARAAYDSLYRANQLLPNRVDVTEKFADICLSYYLADPSHPHFLYTQIAQLSDELLAKNPNSYEGLMLQGYLAETDRKPKQAIELFRKALAVAPGDAGVNTSLVQVLMQDGQTQEAEKLATDLIYRQKTSYGKIYDFMYGVYFSGKRIGDAENVLKAKVANNPKQADYITQLASHYHSLQKPAEMKGALQLLLNNPKDFPNARLWVGDFYMEIRDYPEAIHSYQEGLRASPDKGKTIYRDKTLVALLAQGKREEALHLADEAVGADAKDDYAVRIRGDLWLDGGKPDKLDAALRLFQGLSARSPEDATLRMHLARAYLRKGDLGSAHMQFLEALKRRADFVDAKVELGRIAIMQRRPAEALQQANEILARRPDYRPAKLLRTRALIATGDLKVARTELLRLAKDSPLDNGAKLQMALLAIADKKYAEGVDSLNTLRGSGDPEVFVALASVYSMQRNFDKAIEILNDGVKKSDNPILVHTQLATTAAYAKRYDLAIAEFQKVLEADPKSVETIRRLADVYELKGAQEDAIKLYRQAYEIAPNDLASGLALAGALGSAGHKDEARTKYLGIVKAHPDDPDVLNNTAYLLADTGGDLDQALGFAQSALAKSPSQPAYADTVGYIYLKKGQRDSAIQTFNNLVRKYPHFATFRYHLGMGLYERGDKAAARKELQTALADHPSKQDEQRIKELLAKSS